MTNTWKKSLFVAGGVFAIAALGSCADPVHDLQVKALGSEAPNVPTGEYHRAGQPCVTCHGQYGPASTQFAIAGTIFHGPDKAIGEDLVTIEMIDATGSQRQATTNCVGNFSIPTSDWDPAFPVIVWIRKGQTAPHMNSHIGREPSCSQCHKDPPSFDSPGHIHLLPAEDNAPPPDNCPVSPVADLPGAQQ
jgi:hypothetical protein